MRLTHAEAQALVSARLDGPLDPVAERELNAHLATCSSCRAFNASASQLARGLQAMPYLPASPAVTRAVLDHVSTPRSPWTWLTGALPANALPAATALAAAVIVVFAGAFAAIRFLDDDEPNTIPALTQTTADLAQGPAETATVEDEDETSISVAPTGEGGSETNEPVATDQPSGTDATEQPPAETSEAFTTSSVETEDAGTDATEEAAGADDEVIDPQPTTGDAERSTLATEEPDQSTKEDGGSTEAAEQPTEGASTESTSNLRAGSSTEQPVETATEEPAPEPTAEPTEEPTAEPTPVPTEAPTSIPTEEPTPAPTEEPTEVPTEQPTMQPTDDPSTLQEVGPPETPTPEPEPTEEPVPTDEPTEEPAPTEEPTLEPTEEPTEDPTVEPTEEPVPTEVPTDESEPTSEPTPTVPPIELREETPVEDGTESPVEGGDDVTEEPGTGNAGEATEQIIGEELPETTEAGSPEDTGEGGVEDGQIIEPRGDDDGDDGDDEGPDPEGDGANDGTVGVDETETSSVSLGSADEYDSIANVPGDPGTRLGLSADGDLIFSVNPGRVSLEQNGVTLETGDGPTGQVVFACDQNDSCVDISSGTGEGSGYTDTPIGWIGDEVIYERLNGDEDPVEFRAITLDSSMQPVGDRLIGGGDFDIETMIRPYPVNGGLLVPSPSAWLLITQSSVDTIDGNPYGRDLGQIRFNPSTEQISYVAGGNLILASIYSPGTPILQLPFSGAEHDFSPDRQRIAVRTDAGIEIWDTQGNVLLSYPNDDGIAVGSLSWLNEGLVYVDLSNGVLRIVQP
jgi:hypothetical protein